MGYAALRTSEFSACSTQTKKSKNMFTAILKIRNKPVPFVVERMRFVVDSMTGNAIYTTPVPGLSTITTETDLLDTYFQDALSGDRNKKALMRQQLEKVFGLASLLTGYVQVTSGGDLDKIQSAGFLVKKSSVPVGILPPPANVHASFGKHPGEIILRWGGVPKRTEYMVQMSPEPVTPESWVDVPNGLTGKVQLAIKGLATGRVYWFHVFANGSAGLSGPSDLSSHMAP